MYGLRIKHLALLMCFFVSGCATATVKAVGDPERPITINAHITIDINGLQDTADGIEDYVSGKESTESMKGEEL